VTTGFLRFLLTLFLGLILLGALGAGVYLAMG
jgi:hypothetical protein